MTSPDPFVTVREDDPDEMVWDDFDPLDDDRRESDQEAESLLHWYGVE